MMPISAKRKIADSKQKTAIQVVQPLLSSPVEEYCLALLLQHPELKSSSEGLLPEYFENTQNREVFTAWQQTTDPSLLKDKLDPAIWEHVDYLTSKSILATQIEQKYTDCVLNLRQKFLQGLEAKKAEILALEAEAGGTAAELAKLEEQGIDVSIQLGEVFARKARTSQEQRR